MNQIKKKAKRGRV